MAKISAVLIKDSMSCRFGHQARISTFVLEYPRFIHAELMTHRVFSRNSASSRAIPVATLIELTETNPVTPVHWGLNQPGMKAQNELTGEDRVRARRVWKQAARNARWAARELDKVGVHKQIANRVLECFQHIKVVVTATDFANFFALRTHADAQPEIRELADRMYSAYTSSLPRQLLRGEWHLPFVLTLRGADRLHYFVGNEELTLEQAKKVSASACAQVSYRKEDLALETAFRVFERLVEAQPVHASPFEHQATPLFFAGSRRRNFRGWKQYRVEIPFETVRQFGAARR